MQTRARIFARTLALTAALFWGLVGPSGVERASAQGISLLRDAETEWFLQWVGEPLFEAAGLAPGAVDIYLVNSEVMNAFVVGGQNVFFHAGLIMELDDINQLLGVYAHEIGHITGAHGVRRDEAGAPGTAIALLSMILGAAAIASGATDAGMAAMMGGQTVAQRSYLSYSRSQESRADQAGAGFLDATETSGKGMLETFEKFRDQELLTTRRRDPYIQTHPLSGARLASLTNRVQASPYYNKPARQDYAHWYTRIRAKLKGYMQKPELTLQDYPESNQAPYARYARVYAYQKDLQFDRAFNEAKRLADDFPDDPYYWEIAAQILLESGKVEESLTYYRKALEILPENTIFMTQLSHALVALDREELDKEAIEILERIVARDRQNSFAWLQMATVYTRQDNIGRASLASAEMFQLYGHAPNARRHAGIAMKELEEGSPGWIRAQDIMIQTEYAMEEFMRQQRRTQRRNAAPDQIKSFNEDE